MTFQSQIYPHSVLITALQETYYYSHVMDAKTQAHKVSVICSKSHSQLVAVLEFEPRNTGFRNSVQKCSAIFFIYLKRNIKNNEVCFNLRHFFLTGTL